MNKVMLALMRCRPATSNRPTDCRCDYVTRYLYFIDAKECDDSLSMTCGANGNCDYSDYTCNCNNGYKGTICDQCKLQLYMFYALCTLSWLHPQSILSFKPLLVLVCVHLYFCLCWHLLYTVVECFNSVWYQIK